MAMALIKTRTRLSAMSEQEAFFYIRQLNNNKLQIETRHDGYCMVWSTFYPRSAFTQIIHIDHIASRKHECFLFIVP
jgi:hypothetical protein